MKRLISLMIVLALTLAGFSALADGAADGTYTASGEGKDGPVVVETTFEGGKITSVVVTEQNETPEIARLPLEQIPAAIVKADAWDVDSVTGATITSDAIKAAVKDAIVQAGGNPAAYEKGEWQRLDDGSFSVDCLDSAEYGFYPYKRWIEMN